MSMGFVFLVRNAGIVVLDRRGQSGSMTPREGRWRNNAVSPLRRFTSSTQEKLAGNGRSRSESSKASTTASSWTVPHKSPVVRCMKLGRASAAVGHSGRRIFNRRLRGSERKTKLHAPAWTRDHSFPSMQSASNARVGNVAVAAITKRGCAGRHYPLKRETPMRMIEVALTVGLRGFEPPTS